MNSHAHSRIESGATRTPALVLIAAVLAPAVVSLVVLFSQMNPFPYQDDYGAILHFAIGFQHLHGFMARCLYIVAAQSNEYKLIFEHVIVAAELVTTHHLNFTFLTGAGNLLILPIGFVMWLGYPAQGKSLQEKLREFLPSSLIIFALGYWENLDWAMTGLQNIAIVLFSLLALFFLTKETGPRVITRAMMLGGALAIVAACTSANGFLLAPAGSVFLLSQRAWRRLLVWDALFVIPLAMYLYGYHSAVQGSHGSLAAVPLFFLDFVGWAIPVRSGAAVLAVLLLWIAVDAVRRRFDRVSPFTVYAGLWALLTAALVAMVRGSGGFGISARYTIYSQLLVAFSYTFLRYRWPAEFKRLERVVIVGSVLYFLLVDTRAWKSLHIRDRMVLAGFRFYKENPAVNSPMIDPEVMRLAPLEKAGELVEINRAIAAGVYTLPQK